MSNLRDRVSKLERATGGAGDSPYCQCGGPPSLIVDWQTGDARHPPSEPAQPELCERCGKPKELVTFRVVRWPGDDEPNGGNER